MRISCKGSTITPRRTVWDYSISLHIAILVLGQNGSGQNGKDKIVWTKWYMDKTVLDKMVWTKWYGQNGTDKILRIKSSINAAPIDNMIFSSIPRPL